MQNQILVLIGPKYSGKSQVARQLTDPDELRAAGLPIKPRVVVVDPVGEYGGCVIDNPDALADYINARGDGEFHVSYRDKGLDGRDMSQVFRMMQSLRNCWLVVEEAWKWCGPSQPDRNVTWFVDYGRHNGINSIWVTQRAAHLHRDITFNADLVVCFAQNEPRDLEYLAKVNAEAAAEVALLGPHEWTWVKVADCETKRELEVLSDGLADDTSGAGTDNHARGRGAVQPIPADGDEGATSPGAGTTGAGPTGTPGPDGATADDPAASDDPKPGRDKPATGRVRRRARNPGRSGGPGKV